MSSKAARTKGSGERYPLDFYKQQNVSGNQTHNVEAATLPFAGLLDIQGTSFLGAILAASTDVATNVMGTLYMATIVRHKWNEFGRKKFQFAAALYIVELLLWVAVSYTQSRVTETTDDARLSSSGGLVAAVLFGLIALLVARSILVELVILARVPPGGYGWFIYGMLSPLCGIVYFSSIQHKLRATRVDILGARVRSNLYDWFCTASFGPTLTVAGCMLSLFLRTCVVVIGGRHYRWCHAPPGIAFSGISFRSSKCREDHADGKFIFCLDASC